VHQLTCSHVLCLHHQGEYIQHEEVKAAMGIKIAAVGLEHAIAGSPLLVCGKDDDIEDLKVSTCVWICVRVCGFCLSCNDLG